MCSSDHEDDYDEICALFFELQISSPTYSETSLNKDVHYYGLLWRCPDNSGQCTLYVQIDHVPQKYDSLVSFRGQYEGMSLILTYGWIAWDIDRARLVRLLHA